MNSSPRAALFVGIAALTLAGSGLAGAVPAAPTAPAPQSSPQTPGWVDHSAAASPLDQLAPEPVPAALHAQEINQWVKNVAARVPNQAADPWAVIDKCVTDDMAGDPSTPADDNPAASIAIAVDGVITYTKGYGVKDVTAGGEVDANTLFRIGSTTKMMTAAAIMQLREAGTVKLDAPLPTYLPEFQLGHPWQAEDLTLHRLLSHQSGLIDQYFVSDLSTPLMSWVRAAGTYSLPLYAAPGSFWNYSNPNFSLAGAVVDRVSGIPYNDYMVQKIWQPAGMPLTTLDPTQVISTGNYATGYHNGQPLGPKGFDIPMLGPAGMAFSTPTEMVKWALLLQSGDDRVLSAESKRLMQQRQISLGYLPWMDYGYGIFVTDWRAKADPAQRVVVYDHGGNVNGGSSQLFWVPARGVAVSLLSNTIRSLGNAAVCAVQTLTDIEMIPPDGTATKPETWDAFTGTYSMMDLFGWPWTANVRRVSDTLALDFSDIAGDAVLMGDDIQFPYIYADVFVAIAQSLLLPGAGFDFTFIRDHGSPARVRYMRNRLIVGQRVGQFPERVAVTSDSCAPLRFTSGLDMPVLSIRTSGLVSPTRMISAPLTAGNPADPSTAKIKLDVSVGTGGAQMVYVVADSEPDDAVALYLVADSNGDGQFTLTDDEVVGRGVNGYGSSLLYLSDPLPPGNYQLWVNGVVVQGENSVLNLDMTVMQGDHLRLENKPRGLSDGATWEMRVCPSDVKGFAEPLTGMIQFSYDSPPRLFRIMVDWQPAAAPPLIYLPLGVSGHQLR